MTETDLVKLEQNYEACLMVLRPNAVGIVDAFDYPDFVLGSALGAYDGNVYERLFAEAMKSPLNQVMSDDELASAFIIKWYFLICFQEPVNKTFELYLKPLMKSRL